MPSRAPEAARVGRQPAAGRTPAVGTLVVVAIEQLHRLTFEQFLAVEAANEGRVKHELVGGQLFAMTGGTLRHAACIARVVAALHGPARTDRCRIYQGDALLRIDDAAYYPDVMVACDDQVASRYEVAPCLLAEVLSPPTRGTDEREKSVAYRSIGSLEAYLLIDHEARTVTVYERDGAGWTRRTVGEGGVVDLRCPAASVVVTDLFAGLPD